MLVSLLCWKQPEYEITNMAYNFFVGNCFHVNFHITITNFGWLYPKFPCDFYFSLYWSHLFHHPKPKESKQIKFTTIGIPGKYPSILYFTYTIILNIYSVWIELITWLLLRHTTLTRNITKIFHIRPRQSSLMRDIVTVSPKTLNLLGIKTSQIPTFQ